MSGINSVKKMKIIHTLSKAHDIKSPLALTIGNFDGVHIGHLNLLKRLTDIARKESTESAVITFANHPSTVLRPDQPTPLLCTPAHKIQLLENAQIDLLILLPFTKEFSEQSAKQFLSNLIHLIPVHTLLVGSDAHIGRNREADAAAISQLAHALEFNIEYAKDLLFENSRVTSSRIRECIQKRNFKLAEKLFGRKYSIYAPVIKGQGKGVSLGFPTSNIAVENLCIPPLGVYVVTLKHENIEHPAVANLGIAPTLRQMHPPILEVHLLEKTIDLYGKYVEVVFHAFIRPEQQFPSLEHLKSQIDMDIDYAKAFFKLKKVI